MCLVDPVCSVIVSMGNRKYLYVRWILSDTVIISLGNGK